MRMLVMILCLIAGPGLWADTRVIHSPNDGFLNLRSGPGVEFRLLGRMIDGTSAEVTGRNGNWLRLRHETGAVGWGHSDYLRPKQLERGMMHFVNSPKDGYLNLRRGPGENFGIKKKMLHASAVTVLARKGNWIKIADDKGVRGWAYSAYLSQERPLK